VSVRVGVQIQPQHIDFHTMLDAFRQADELGADTIYTWDHFYPLYGEADGKHWEGLTTLTAMASVTERAKIGGLVFCNSYRNPQLLADAHRTIDHLSNGRVIFGIGAGWFERDYDEYGYTFGTAPDRLRALGRDLPLMKERLTKVNPAPAHEIPFLIGGAGEKVTLKLVAQYAQLWHTFAADLETYHHKVAVLAEHCAKVGRDPASIEHVIGAQENILEKASGLADAGVSEVTIGIGGGDNGSYDFGGVRELLAWRDEYNASH
jgi:probable F420-dependent oxidoreductase